MSIVYSHISDRYLDTDSMDVVELSNGDLIAMADDNSLLLAYQQGLITRDEMYAYGFTNEDLAE